MYNPPPTSDSQMEILNHLDKEPFSYHTLGSSGAAGMFNFSNKIKVKSDDFFYLEKQKLIKRTADGVRATYHLTNLGRDFLNGNWQDPNASKNDEYLNEKFMNNFEPDEIVEPESVITDKTITHESYGTVGLSHQTGGNEVLFGCSTKQNGKVCLRINEAELHRSLNNDRVHTGENIIEIDLSYDQLLSLFFTPNRGEGTPCTIRRRDGKGVEPPPKLEDKRSEFSREFRQTLSKAFEASVSLKEEADRLLSRSGQLKKPERERLQKLLNQLGNAVNSNLSFTEEQFQKQMDKTISEGETQLHGIVSSTLQNMGLEHLKGQIKLPDLED